MPFLAAIAVALVLLLTGCDKRTEAGPEAAPTTKTSGAAPSADTLTVSIAYGSEKKTWLEEQAKQFEASGAKTQSGRAIKIKADAMGSGEAMQGILAGTIKPHVFSPAASPYVSLLNSAWLQQPGHTKPISPAGEALVLSPIVIAMWKPMAEALGWPKKPVSWNDLLKVSRDKAGWGSLAHAEWGRMKLGHTHPEYSNSGLLAVLVEAYAGAKKTRDLSIADLDSKTTQAFLTSLEGTVIHYGKSTGFFADKMLARGPAYISAAVLYENLVIESYSKKNDSGFPVVSIYPVEGTFWSDHPYAVLDAEWVKDEEREAAQAFLAFLKQKSAQQRALALGFRPGDTSIPVASPIDEAHGCDPKQPQTLLELPPAPVLEKLIAVWQTTKKATDLVFVFDKSGSMSGRALAEAKQGAKAFFDVLHARDEVTLLFFDSKLYPAVGPIKVGEGKAELVQRVDGTIAEGGTALYDAVGEAYALAQKRATAEPGRIHAIVVMTDGKDERSKLKLDELTRQFSSEDAQVKIFTIAYGEAADPRILEQIAEAAKGSTAKGSAENIVAVYKDMASFF
jgi:Ca-activated chloride channel homolog